MSFRILLLLLCQFLIARSYDLKCEYSCDVEYQIINTVCRCKVIDFNSNNREMITSVDGLPENSNIELLLIDGQNMKFFPQNITNFLPNLKGIIIDSSNLTSITKNDLKSFRKLQFLFIGNNKIEELQNDLFEDSQKIEWVNFMNNFTKRIGYEILNPLKQLKFANFSRNSCINFKAVGNDQMERLKLLIRRDCSP